MKVLSRSNSESPAPSAVFRGRQPFGLSARLPALAGGVIAFAAVCVLAAPALLAREQAPEAAPAPVSRAPVTALTEADFRQRLSEPNLVIAGERLNVGLLRRFYARHGLAPVWTERPAQATSLIHAVMRAGDEGLDPDLFHANLIRTPGLLPPLDRELLLSDAFLSYADALARGAVPVERRRDDETLTPEPIDVAAVLDAAIDSSNPAAAIEALAPATPSYRLLRQALETAQAEAAVGGKAAARVREIEVNLERQRWLPRRLPTDRVWVNAADERVVLYRNDQPVFSTKVVVGRDVEGLQSPEFQATITGMFFNPPWVIPEDIAEKEMLPKAARDPNYLAQHHIIRLPNGMLEQPAGPKSGLGVLMLEMKNRFDVYLHDTPSKNLFTRDDRRVSHGCIRVENLQELAALLMHRPVEAIDETIATGSTSYADLPQPVPVFVVYQTAFVDSAGNLQFRPDIYGRDAEIWHFLDPEQRIVAQRGPAGLEDADLGSGAGRTSRRQAPDDRALAVTTGPED